MAGMGKPPIAGLWLGAMTTAMLTGCAGQAADGPGAAPSNTASGVAAGPTAAPPSAAVSPSAGPAASHGVPQPNQAFQLQAVDRVEDPVLTVTASGRIGTYPGGADTGEREQFTLSPLSPGATTYLLKTARLRVGGEPLCVGVDGGRPHTTACDAADRDQRVTLVPGPGGTTFDLVVGGFNVEVGQAGKISLVRRDGTGARTVFRFVPTGTVGQWP
ncbi:hypothetical protein [Catellatospora tritici]|uniref:hypothetical protein n=1 Tax=Catellatospora tritici TaxID=2851566 RepID=UPI001C2D8C1B|nr:hypothetical protein [Catellatospora tritici]MBV1854867.1 hypothetical protein [Catellatospora tritici]